MSPDQDHCSRETPSRTTEEDNILQMTLEKLGEDGEEVTDVTASKKEVPLGM